MTIMCTKPLQEMICNEINKTNNQYLKQVELKKLINKEINNALYHAKEDIAFYNIILRYYDNKSGLGLLLENFKFAKLKKYKNVIKISKNIKGKLKRPKIDNNKLRDDDEFEIKTYELICEFSSLRNRQAENIIKYNKPREYKYREYNVTLGSDSCDISYKWHIFQ